MNGHPARGSASMTSMPAMRQQSGKGRIQMLIAMLVIGAVAYAAFKLIPVRAAAYQLDDEVREQVVLAGSRRRRVSDQEMRRHILELAGDLGLPITSRDIEVRRSANTIHIAVRYSVPVQMPFFSFSWPFTSSHDGPIF